MAQYFKIHPDNPELRLLKQTAVLLDQGAVIACPTDSCYALACLPDKRRAIERIFSIRMLQKDHDLTYLCRDMSMLGKLAKLDNDAFRLIKRLTPGPWTFILPASRDVPRRVQYKRSKTIGVRIPATETVLQLLDLVGCPLLGSSLILPGAGIPETDPDEILDRLGGQVDLVIAADHVIAAETSILDLSGDGPRMLRQGLGTGHAIS